MFNFISLYNFNRLFLLCLFATITSMGSIPISAFDAKIYPNNVKFFPKLEKSINKLTQAYGKGKSVKKIIDYTLEIRDSIESSAGVKFGLDNSFAQVEIEAKKAGVEIPAKDLDAIKRMFIKRHDHLEKKGSCSKEILPEDEVYEYTEMGVKINVLTSYRNYKPKKELSNGVLIVLSGVFVEIFYDPTVKEWGRDLIREGLRMCEQATIK